MYHSLLARYTYNQMRLIHKQIIELERPEEVYDIEMTGDNENFAILSENDDNSEVTLVSHNTRPAKSEIFNISNSRFPNGFRYKTDYSQNEVRVLASISHEEKFIEAFKKGLDPHLMTASAMWGKDPKDVTSDERRYAKTCTFSILYGKSIRNVAREYFDGDIQAATDLFNKYYEAFPKIKEFMAEKKEQYDKYDYVTTLFGDRIYIEDTNAKYRQAVNYPIQGSSSCLAGSSLWHLIEYIKSLGFNTKIECFTHDSGEFDVPASEIFDIAYLVPEFLVSNVRKSYGMMVAVDSEMGLRENALAEIEDFTKYDDKPGHYSLKLEMRLKEVDEFIRRIGVCHDIIKYDILGEKSKHISMSNMFLPKKSFSTDIGKDVQYKKFYLEVQQHEKYWRNLNQKD